MRTLIVCAALVCWSHMIVAEIDLRTNSDPTSSTDASHKASVTILASENGGETVKNMDVSEDQSNLQSLSVADDIRGLKEEISAIVFDFKVQVVDLVGKLDLLCGRVEKVERVAEIQTDLGHALSSLMQQVSGVEKKMVFLQREFMSQFIESKPNQVQYEKIGAQMDMICKQIERLERQVKVLSSY